MFSLFLLMNLYEIKNLIVGIELRKRDLNFNLFCSFQILRKIRLRQFNRRAVNRQRDRISNRIFRQLLRKRFIRRNGNAVALAENIAHL